MKNKRNLIIVAGLIVGAFIIFFFVRGSEKNEAAEIITNVQHGTFRVEIETTGELEAKNSVKILGPSTLRDFRIWNVTIQNIVEEGTVVKKGDWVATLDRSEFQGRYNEKQIELEKAQSKYVQVQLDTTLQMRQSRDELINLKYSVEENRIRLEQSKFEPPATIKQAEIDVDKSKRAYEQALENYKIKKRQNAEKMREVGAELRKVQNEFTRMTGISESFNVTAPEPGMVIYTKNWDGTPIKAGSQINMWEPTVATLPDLTKMLSKTYVNEVDVRKVKAGQAVEIGLDAYPDKKLQGKVIRVANVGEQRPNSDAKVFLVDIEIDGTDPSLRPSMTTSNKVVAKVLDSVSYVPLEGLHSQYDSIIYVYKKDGLNTIKQEVIVGETNSNEAVIVAGLNLGDRIYLSVPPDMEDVDVNLLPQLSGKRKKDKDSDSEKTNTADGKVVATPVSIKN
jgi:HlyD family secretion protein